MVDADNLRSKSAAEFNVGIIGLGPKGLYALERLLAQIKNRNIQTPVAIHIFNQNPFFGAGNVYRKDQPSYLIMNYANRNIDIWPSDSPDPILENTPNFSQWLADKTGSSVDSIEDGFASRAVVGEYLMEAFNLLCENAPPNVNITTHITTIKRVIECDGQFKLYTSRNNTIFPIASIPVSPKPRIATMESAFMCINFCDTG